MSTIDSHGPNPMELTVIDGEQRTKLHFVENCGNQECQHCWFEWLDTELCGEVPCNRSDRTDGRIGIWTESKGDKV